MSIGFGGRDLPKNIRQLLPLKVAVVSDLALQPVAGGHVDEKWPRGLQKIEDGKGVDGYLKELKQKGYAPQCRVTVDQAEVVVTLEELADLHPGRLSRHAAFQAERAEAAEWRRILEALDRDPELAAEFEAELTAFRSKAASGVNP